MTTTERIGRAIALGTWGVAGIVMVASAINAVLTYSALGDNRVLGLATGVAVDLALCVALIGDRQMQVHQLASRWGRVLRLTTMSMALTLNAGIAVRDGRWFSALLDAFVPALLVLVTEYGQDVLIAVTRAERPAASAVPSQELPRPQTSAPAVEPQLAAPRPPIAAPIVPPRPIAVGSPLSARGSERPPPTVEKSRPPSQAKRAGVDDVRPLLALGMERTAMAARLGCSVATVDRRLREIRDAESVRLVAVP